MSDLARALEERGEEILREWVDRVRQQLAPGDETRAELEDHIPLFLRQLQAALRGEPSGDRTSPEAGANPVGREHGAQRFRLGFALGALVREYGLLRDLLLDLIVEQQLRVPLAEVRLLTDFVATAITEAVEEHARQQERARSEAQAAHDARLSGLHAEVRRSEAWLSTVLRSIGEAVIVTDAHGHAVFLNPGAEALTGWTREQAQGQPLARVFPLVHEVFRTEVESPLWHVLRDGQTRRLAEPALLVRRDGVHLPIADSMAALRDAEGRVSGVVLVFQDVSEKRRQERELGTFKSLVDASDDYIVLVDLESRVHYMNPAGQRLLGLSGLDQARALPMMDFVSEDSQARVARDVLPRLLQGLHWQGEVLHRHLTTEEAIPLAAHAFPVKDERGQVVLLGCIGRDLREFQRQKAELERAERARTAMLDALAAQNLVAVNYLRGPEHVFERANPRYVQLVDREVLGQPFLQALPELEAQGLGALLDETFQSATPLIRRECPFQLRSREGAPHARLFDFVLQPVLDAEGRVEGILNLAIDSTEHVRARQAAEQLAEQERARRDAEARLRLLAESERMRLDALFMQAPVAITVLHGPRFVVELANPPMLRIWGRAARRVVGLPLLDALPELRGQGLEDLLHGVLTTGRPLVAMEMEIPLARGEGGGLETGYFNFVYTPLRDAQGQPEAVLALATEVTEAVRSRRTVEELLKRSQEAEQSRAALLDALAAQPLIAVSYLHGPDHVAQSQNALNRQLAGRDSLGLPFRQVFPELDQQGFTALLDRVRETGEPWMNHEAVLWMEATPATPAHELLLDFVYQPVRAPGGGVDGILTLALEVTKQVHARREAQRLAGDERRLRDVEQYLIGIVSHDLRNPLSAILLGVQVLLRREGWDARTQQSLARLLSSTERAVRMVRDLLDFTQARLGGGLKIDRAPMDVHAVVRGVVEELQSTHPERELRWEQHGEASGQWDADRVAQLMGNLVGNALKYSPRDSPVTVRSLGEAEGIRLDVHNGGEPIPAEAMERLFQPLQRAVEGSDMAGRSVGLGLYIVDQIVRAHGGDVQVTSTEHEGTTFRVRLPRLTAPEGSPGEA